MLATRIFLRGRLASTNALLAVVCLAQFGQHDRWTIETELQARGGAPEEAIARVEFQYHATMMPQGAEAASE